MNNIIISTLALFLVFVTFSPGSVSSVSIHVNPSSRKITCLADKLDPPARNIASIQLYSPDNDVIVRMDQSSNVTVDKDPHLFIIETEGKIEKKAEKSNLTVKMSDILSTHSGIYICKIYYVGMKGNNHDQSAHDLLNITRQDTHILLDTLRYKLWTLEKGMKDQAKVALRVHNLEGWADKQNTMMTNMKQRATYMSAFAAGYDGETDLLEQNKVLVFRKVFMKVGGGYDETKGIFTAPVHGYYVFHLTVFYEDYSNKDLGVNIVANNKPVAQAYVDDPKDNIQASVNTFVELKAGEQAKAVVSHLLGITKTLNLDIKRSLFSGYLIKQS